MALQSTGAEGVTQMLKCVATARRRLLPRNEDFACLVGAGLQAHRASRPPAAPGLPRGGALSARLAGRALAPPACLAGRAVPRLPLAELAALSPASPWLSWPRCCLPLPPPPPPQVRAYKTELPPNELFPNGSTQIRLVLLVVRCLPFKPLCWVIKPLVPDAAEGSSLARASGYTGGAQFEEYVPLEGLQGWSARGERLEEVAKRQLELLEAGDAARFADSRAEER